MRLDQFDFSQTLRKASYVSVRPSFKDSWSTLKQKHTPILQNTFDKIGQSAAGFSSVRNYSVFDRLSTNNFEQRESFDLVESFFVDYEQSHDSQAFQDTLAELIGSDLSWQTKVDLIAATADFDVCPSHNQLIQALQTHLSHEHGLVFLAAARLLVETKNLPDDVVAGLPQDRQTAIERLVNLTG